MPQLSKTRVGVMFRRENAPETLPEFARRAEQLGFGELWVVEDCFYGSGIASAAVALASTSEIRVGLGIMPAVARNAAFTAMEIATLARLYPRRYMAGIGHGVTEWMKQVGAFPKSQLKALGETAQVVRALLAGEEVTYHGDHVSLEHVRLEFPPEHIPPVLLGVRGPKSLALSGRTADGTVLAELASPAYIRWAVEMIQHGQQEAGRTGEAHTVVTYVLCAVDADGKAARERMRPLVAGLLSYDQGDYVRPLGIEADVNELRSQGGRERLRQEMPDSWIEQMTVVGTPAECATSIHHLIDAGASSAILVPEQLGVFGLNETAPILAEL